MKLIFDKHFFTIRETASLLSISQETIKSWIRSGKIKAVRLGRERHISETELKNFLKITTND